MNKPEGYVTGSQIVHCKDCFYSRPVRAGDRTTHGTHTITCVLCKETVDKYGHCNSAERPK